MAYEIGPRSHESYRAGADLSALQYNVVTFNSSRDIVVISGAGAGSGILDNAPILGDTANLVTAGVTKVKCGGNIVAGDKLIANAAGLAIAATQETSEGYIFGVAREAGSDGAIIAARVDFSGATWSSVDAIA